MAPRVNQAGTPRALLVDPDSHTRTMYGQFLTLEGWEVDEAENGREALAKAIAGHPSVIVTDTTLRYIDGYELCRLLRADTECAALPIIVVTDEARPAQIKRAQRAGADAVLTKPCVREALREEIRRVTECSRERPEPPRSRSSESDDQSAGDGRSANRSLSDHRSLVRAHHRYETTTPPIAPPTLLCPVCNAPLEYQRSHVGGVTARQQEQWDDFACSRSCGLFQYRQRTRKIRRAWS